MNPMADPAFVAAEVAYRFETGKITHPVTAGPTRRQRVGRWLRDLIHPTRGQHSRARHHRTRTQRA